MSIIIFFGLFLLGVCLIVFRKKLEESIYLWYKHLDLPDNVNSVTSKMATVLAAVIMIVAGLLGMLMEILTYMEK